MKIRKIDHLGIRVMEFERSSNFYKQFGFEITREDFKERVVVLKHPNGLEINLLDSGNDDNGRSNILMDVEDKYPGYTHYAIEVESVEAAKNYLESISIEITGGPVTFGDGKTSVFVRDPDRNVIEFTQLPKA